MSAGPSRGATDYARAIERLWSAATDRPVILSPRDWSLICDWYEQGIPLPLIDEAIRSLGERRAGRPAPRGLSYLSATVQESWRVVCEGRLVEDPVEPQATCAGSSEIRAAWDLRAAIERADGTKLGRELDRLRRAWDEGQPIDEIDRRLDEGLGSWVAAELVDETRRSVVETLRPFRDRMPETTWNQTVHRGLIDRLREHLGLPHPPAPGTGC